MKTSKSIKNLGLRMVLFAILLSSLFAQKAYSSAEYVEEIPLDGRWETKERSISLIPITASTDGQCICIENSSPNCDITIIIISNNTGEKVYSQTISGAQTAYIAIPIENLISGNYTLQLTNQYSGNLLGIFTK